MNRILTLVSAFTMLVLIAACSGGGEGAKQATPEAARPPVAAEAAVAAAGTLTEGIDVTGSLAPKFEVGVKSEVAGLVSEVAVTEWVRVKKGELLARVDIREQEALARRTEAALEAAASAEQQALVADNRARRELERMRQLMDNGLATRQAFDDASTEAKAAASRVDAARAQVRVAREDLNQVRTRLAKGRITAPIEGIVSERRVNVGDLVGEAGANPPLFHIVDNRILNLTVSVPSVSMAALRRGQRLEFTTDAFPGRTFGGTVMFINPSVNEADRSVRVIAEVDNASGELKGGLFVQGRIITGRRSGVLLVPREALLGWDIGGNKARLFVIESDRAKTREVRTGTATDGSVEITAGLKPGESYVVRGAFNVREGDTLLIAGKRGVEP
ncbi:MAG: efflux RND transporter periplasmic adaptor subunit [Thermodesulfobacteriota bacterium]